MSRRHFMEMLRAQFKLGRFACVGLDSERDKIKPEMVQRTTTLNRLCHFNHAIIDATRDIAGCYKLNLAFYWGDEALHALRESIAYIHKVAPDVPVILDAKYADIGNTNEGYVQQAFEYLQADAVTLNPYLGRKALEPFLKLEDKGAILLCRTSNEGSGEFQDRRLLLDPAEFQAFEQRIGHEVPEGSVPLYQYVAYQIATSWNIKGNCALVVGATYPEELGEVRKIAGDMPLLIPGIGAQGGDLERTVRAGLDASGQGILINSSRGIIFASSNADFASVARQEAQKLHDEITRIRAEVRVGK